MDNRYHHHNRRKYNLKYIVLVTKYRKQLLSRVIVADIKQTDTIQRYIESQG